MVHGIDGNFGILSNVESATYTFVWMLLGSSPTSGTKLDSATADLPGWRIWEEPRLRRNSPARSSRNTPNLYQYNFNANWISRDVRWNSGGWPADVICPTLKLPICAFGLLNCGVFKKLNASARNCTRLF